MRVDDLLPILCCSACRADLTATQSEFHCSACGRSFPWDRDVARFVDSRNYADNFGFQWQKYALTQMDGERQNASEIDFRKKAGLTAAELSGKRVLDVGCGTGRYAEVATRYGARVVGVDLSAAAEVAAVNLAARNFTALQADVFGLPFKPESFDVIYSIGVLHHTPDCEQAVKVLPQYLKPGGILAVWLYSGYNKWYRFSDYYRKVTHRMAPQRLHRLLSTVVPLLNGVDRMLKLIPLVGKPAAEAVHYVLPVNRHPDPAWRVLETFDWYSPKYQSKHTYEQVFRWFENCGLVDLKVVETPISMRGRKPERTGLETEREAWQQELQHS
jgi:2-polyprenyl-3-methyl-5-hydroxy-6-metoxy-1,4-benzoquinol methylase